MRSPTLPHGSKYTTPAECQCIDSITADLKGAPADVNAFVALASTGGLPTIGVGQAQSVPADPDVVTFTFSPAAVVSPSTLYLLGLVLNDI